MEQYNVTGMSCAACQTRVEKAVNALPGVESCAVSLLTNSMGVTGTASEEEIIKAVTDAGYGASKKGQERVGESAYDDSLKDTETPKMRKRLIASLILLLPLMYVSMGHMMWNWPLPAFMEGNHLAMGIYEMLLAGLVMVINQKFFISGFKGLIHRSPNMDTLVALGATASFGYSVYALFAMTGAVMARDMDLTMHYMDEFYFESAAMILTLITVGKMLESHSKGKTTNALKALMDLKPRTAVILKDNIEMEVAIDKVMVGDLFVVRSGDSIPVDGVVIEGSAAIDESALTGESMPADKAEGDKVFAATINQTGYMVCKAERVAEDTTLSGIIRMVSDAAATKAPIAKVADRVSGIFVPAVMLISLVTFIVWLLTGQTLGYSLARAISVLVISCPCALGLATPVAIMVGNGLSARTGILFKTAESLEETGKVQIVALDKTGTITEGNMLVTDVISLSEYDDREILRLAYALEAKSEHPISKAITEKAKENGLDLLEISDLSILPGKGLSGRLAETRLAAGNLKYITGLTGNLKGNFAERIKELSNQGKTPVLIAKDDEAIGIIAVSDTVKADSPKAITELKKMGLHVVMLTGDNEITARAIAEKSGVDEVVANVKPDGKEEVVRELMKHGKVAMVGDGINDAIALTRADVGVAIGAGTDIAIEAADLVLMKSSLRDFAAAIRISRKTLRNIHENLFWAFFYNIIGIPLAAGCYVAAFGWTLNPMFGAMAMSLSSFCVVTNALRLNLVKAYDGSHDKEVKKPVTGPLIEIKKKDEDNKMKVTVNGMMCGHCEAHVVKEIEKIEGVTSVVANHDENLVTIEASRELTEDEVKAAVLEAGYEYVGICQ